MQGVYDLNSVMGLMMIGCAVGGFLGQAVMGAATLLRLRSVIDVRVAPLEKQLSTMREATNGRLDVHESRLAKTERCEHCHGCRAAHASPRS